MKINGPIPALTGTESVNRAKSASSARKPGDVSDQVELSSSAQLQDAGSVMSDTPTVNASQVAEIKQAISEGRFKINADRIADGLLQDVRDLLSRQRG